MDSQFSDGSLLLEFEYDDLDSLFCQVPAPHMNNRPDGGPYCFDSLASTQEVVERNPTCAMRAGDSAIGACIRPGNARDDGPGYGISSLGVDTSYLTPPLLQSSLYPANTTGISFAMDEWSPNYPDLDTMEPITVSHSQHSLEPLSTEYIHSTIRPANFSSLSDPFFWNREEPSIQRDLNDSVGIGNSSLDAEDNSSPANNFNIVFGYETSETHEFNSISNANHHQSLDLVFGSGGTWQSMLPPRIPANNQFEHDTTDRCPQIHTTTESHPTVPFPVSIATPTVSESSSSTAKHDVLLKNSLTVLPTLLRPQPLSHPPEALMTSFESSQVELSSSRGKRAYTTEARKKVSQVRKKGACLRCRIRKIACSADDEICSRCQNVTNTPGIAQRICVRQKLIDVFISHSSIYEMILESQDRNSRAINLLPGQTEQRFFRMETMGLDSSTLAITATRYERVCPSLGLSGSYTILVPSWHGASNDQRAISPISLPTIEELDDFARSGTCKVHDPFLSYDLHHKIDRLLLLCCERERQSPVGRLVNATLRVVNLRSFLMHSLVHALNTKQDDSDGSASRFQSTYVDPVLNMQIRTIALAGIAKSERFLFSQFNDLSRILALDESSLMLAKTCLLRLMLIYRNDVLLCQRSVMIPTKSRVIFANRLKKVKFMYHLAAATYGTLSERVSSCVPFEWKLDAYEKYSGHDGSAEGFEKAVKELSVAYTTFCEHELLPEDGIFNFFVMESGRKVGRT